MIIVLDRLGDFLLKLVKHLNSIFEDLLLFIGIFYFNITYIYSVSGVKTRLMRIKSEKSLKRYIEMSKKFAFIGFSGSLPKDNVIHVEKKSPEPEKTETSIDIPESEAESIDDWKRNPPVLASIIFTVLWVVAASATFCLWEDWSYGTSVYFFIISTSTIGFGILFLNNT